MITALFALALSTAPAADTPIADAVAACIGVEGALGDPLEERHFEVLDDGHSVIVEGARVFDAYDCIEAGLGLPEWPRTLINATSGNPVPVSIEVEAGYTIVWVWTSDELTVVIYDSEAA